MQKITLFNLGFVKKMALNLILKTLTDIGESGSIQARFKRKSLELSWKTLEHPSSSSQE